MTVLKPCPFCRGEGRYFSYDDEGDKFHTVRCKKCFCAFDGNTSENKAIERWNTRIDLIPQPITDEARAKALDDAINEWRVYQETYHAGYGVASTTILVDKIIKAALSQPSIPVRDELEALKAENAELRQAVVDLANCLDEFNSLGTVEDLINAHVKHAITISKAKAVQG